MTSLREKIDAVANKNINIFTVIVAAISLTYIRNPLFFAAPRIWAEEGLIYLFDALVQDPTSSFLTPHYGYYSLFNKIAIYMASQILPLEYAAHITTFFSASLQLFTCLVIYISAGRLGRSKLHRFFLSLIPLLVAYQETWLNTINGHFWLATGTYFILNSARINLAQIMYLFLAFTTGGASLFFLPYFILRALKEKTIQLWSVVIVGATATTIQFFSLYSYIEEGGNARLKIEFLGNLAKGVLYTAIIPLQQKNAGIFFAIFIVFAIYKYAKYLISTGDKLGLVYSLGSLVTYTILSVLSSLYMNGGSRYGVPVHCELLAIALCGLSLKKFTRSDIVYAASFAIISVLIVTSYFNMESVYSTTWPRWQTQLKNRNCNENSEILLFPQWPAASWRMLVPKGAGVECRTSLSSY